MNFSFIDQIIDLVPGQQATGIKTITLNDNSYLAPAEKGLSLLPCMLAECIGQLNAWIVMQQNDFSFRPIAILYRELEFLGQAHLGDQIKLTTTLKAIDEKTSLFDGEILLNNKPIFKVHDAAGAFLPMENFIDRKGVMHQFDLLKKPYRAVMVCYNSSIDKPNILNNSANLEYDSIIEEQENFIIAKKNISQNQPFFADHFPKKPILPISILLQSKVGLAKELLRRVSLPEMTLFKISNVKINEFIFPSSELVTKVQIKEKNKEFIILQTQTDMAGKRVCRADVTLKLSSTAGS